MHKYMEEVGEEEEEEKSKDSTSCTSSASMFWYKAFYVFFIGAFWMKIVYLPLYFKQIGLPAHYAGVLAGVSPFLRGAGSFCLGLLGEKPETRKVLLLMSLIAQILTPLLCLIPHPAAKPSIANGTLILNKTSMVPLHALQDTPPATDYLETIQKCMKGDCFGYLITTDDDEPDIPKTSSSALLTNTTAPRSPLLDIDLNIIDTFWIIVAIITVGEFLGGPARSLADAATLQALGRDKSKFGYIRLWGNVGQFFLTMIIYLLLRYEHKTINGVEEGNYLFAVIAIAFWMALAFPTALGFACDYKKDLKGAAKEIDDTDNEPDVELVDVLVNFTSLSLMVITFCIGMLNGTFNTFMFWFVLDIAGSNANLIITIALALRILFIILAFRVSGTVIRYLGVMNITHISLMLYCGIYALYGLMKNPWLAIIPEVLQNIIKAFTEVAVILYFGEITPFRWSAIVQGIIQCLLEGFGFGIGPIIGGFMVYSIGIRTTFFIFGAFAAGVGIFSMCNHGISWILKGSSDRVEYHGLKNDHD